MIIATYFYTVLQSDTCRPNTCRSNLKHRATKIRKCIETCEGALQNSNSASAGNLIYASQFKKLMASKYIRDEGPESRNLIYVLQHLESQDGGGNKYRAIISIYICL